MFTSRSIITLLCFTLLACDLTVPVGEADSETDTGCDTTVDDVRTEPDTVPGCCFCIDGVAHDCALEDSERFLGCANHATQYPDGPAQIVECSLDEPLAVEDEQGCPLAC